MYCWIDPAGTALAGHHSCNRIAELGDLQAISYNVQTNRRRGPEIRRHKSTNRKGQAKLDSSRKINNGKVLTLALLRKFFKVK